MIWRLPFGAKPEPWPLVGFDVRERYPALARRCDDLEDLGVEELFHESDSEALIHQRRYRRTQVWLILGAAVTSFIGALQLVIEGGQVFTGAAIAVAGIGTSFLARSQRTSGPLDRYIRSRSKAERLRSLYFRHLGGARGDRADLEADLASITYPSERGRVR